MVNLVSCAQESRIYTFRHSTKHTHSKPGKEKEKALINKISLLLPQLTTGSRLQARQTCVQGNSQHCNLVVLDNRGDYFILCFCNSSVGVTVAIQNLERHGNSNPCTLQAPPLFSGACGGLNLPSTMRGKYRHTVPSSLTEFANFPCK